MIIAHTSCVEILEYIKKMDFRKNQKVLDKSIALITRNKWIGYHFNHLSKIDQSMRHQENKEDEIFLK